MAHPITDIMNTFEKGMTRLLTAQLSEMYGCEKQLLPALDSMAKAARDPELRSHFAEHRTQTLQHLERLETAFAELDEKPSTQPCRGMDGLLETGRWLRRSMKEDPAFDHILIAAAQKVEAMEVAGYRSIIRLSEQLGHDEVAELCTTSMMEEQDAEGELDALAFRMNVPYSKAC